MKKPRLWLPRSLAGRVFALYAIALVLFVAGGLVLFYRYEFLVELENTHLRAEALVEVIAPAVADSAVIGDYDTIRHTLGRAIRHSDYAGAAFIDIKGAKIEAASDEEPQAVPPGWLRHVIAAGLYDTNRPITVGGRDYGVLRLRFDAESIAGALWAQFRAALALAALALGGGLLVFRLALKRWLGNLDRIESLEADMRSGVLSPERALADDAPIELKRTFDVISRAAANVQMQREQAAVTLGAIADGVLTLDAQGRVVLANPAACEALGLAREQVLSRTAHELLPEIFGARASYAPWRARRAGIHARDGRTRVLDTTLSSITGPDGELHGHVLTCHDVSEQHALDQKLQEQLRARQAALTALRGILEGLMSQAGTPGAAERAPVPAGGDIEAISHMISGLVQRLREHGEQLDAIFALSPDGFVSFDHARRVSYVSPGFTRLTGLAAEEVAGQDEARFAALLGARCARDVHAMPGFDTLRRAEAESSGHGREGAAPRRVLLDLERPTRRTLVVTLRPGDGAISQVLYLRDVTHETEVDQMKSEFLSTAAHELRTPMANIYGFAELMMNRKLSPAKQADVIATVHRQTGLMISIVNELLDLARIEARRGKDFNIERLDLRALVAEVVHDFKPPQERPAPAVEQPAQPLPVRVDRSKLAQALGNVLSNAYKYSPAGGEVRLALRLEGPDGPGGCEGDNAAPRRVGLVVRDQGIGMTPGQLARVSERFYRADTSGNIPGTGLGMSIVKEIVELLGGSLQLASEPGQGTEVTLWLPLAQGAPDEAPAAAPAPAAATDATVPGSGEVLIVAA
ncbi:PAS domain-containing sensor histidine kinase [Azohydromonas aeria]|uniref:PAS domain-containing sensor histidine kinase n=1 Tax=Azohydromonas aeria TaxID=2590212 RepID=UPI0012FB9D33|nr:ATP-binding protein [Azohydromonas aeria]